MVNCAQGMSHPVIQALAYIHWSSTADANEHASVLAPPRAGKISHLPWLNHYNALLPLV